VKVVRVAAPLLVLAGAWLGCGDSASSGQDGPRVVSVLGAGSERATGFVVAPGRLVTVAHALEGRRLVRVRAGGRLRRARIMLVDRQADLALLAVPALRAGAPRVGAATNDEDAGVLVLRAGRPAALSAAVRRTIDARVGAPGGARLRRPALELEARTRAGDSGAPVVRENGEVMGVLFARSRTEENTAYAVDAGELAELLAGD
jgi:S1-C subfamily serine protease